MRGDSSSPASRRRRAGLFRREGDYWTIAYEGSVVRLKDAKGLHYLGQLLRHPGRAFEVVELKMLVADGARLTPGRRAPSVDPGGGDAAERARKAVTNRIRQAVVRIGAAHERLGLHFANAVHTGSRCAYTPDRPTPWET